MTTIVNARTIINRRRANAKNNGNGAEVKLSNCIRGIYGERRRDVTHDMMDGFRLNVVNVTRAAAAVAAAFDGGGRGREWEL